MLKQALGCNQVAGSITSGSPQICISVAGANLRRQRWYVGSPQRWQHFGTNHLCRNTPPPASNTLISFSQTVPFCSPPHHLIHTTNLSTLVHRWGAPLYYLQQWIQLCSHTCFLNSIYYSVKFATKVCHTFQQWSLSIRLVCNCTKTLARPDIIAVISIFF